MKTALMTLTDAEFSDFFPGSLKTNLETLLPELRRASPAKDGGENIAASMDRLRPEILITGWSTPSLPVDKVRDFSRFLKYICHTAGSVRRVVPPQYIESGVTVTNWGSSVALCVAEGALTLILAALRRTSHWALELHCRQGWKDDNPQTSTLIGKKVGIHGFGEVCKALLALLKPFNVSVSVFSPYESDAAFSERGVRRAPSLEELFSLSDVIVELAPGIPENHHAVGKALLNKIRPGACFVNIGRGMVVDEEALAEAAREGKIRVALDVFETEPLPRNSPLRGLPNVTLSPHLSGPTIDYRWRCGRHTLENIARYLAGEKLASVVTPEIYSRAS